MGVSVPLFCSEEERHSTLTVLASILTWENFSRRLRSSRRVVSPFPSRTTVSSSRDDSKLIDNFSPGCPSWRASANDGTSNDRAMSQRIIVLPFGWSSTLYYSPLQPNASFRLRL